MNAAGHYYEFSGRSTGPAGSIAPTGRQARAPQGAAYAGIHAMHKSRFSPRYVIGIALCLGAHGTVRAFGGDQGLATDATHRVRVVPPRGVGIEADMPRDGWYARGIRLDMAARWQESYRAYGEAEDRFRRLARQRPRKARQLMLWAYKAAFQRGQSDMLRHAAQWRYQPSANRLYEVAMAKHHKWLAIRAFAGRRQHRLQHQIIAAYEQAVESAPDYFAVRARLALAAFLHEVGQHARARRIYAQLEQPVSADLPVLQAYYYTANDDADRAMPALRKALHRGYSYRRQILASNFFDRLHNDARFRRLLQLP